MELKFRTLNADEIEARIGRTNAGGVSILLYKDARADQNVLDETVGPMNWQRHHSRDNKNCTVSIYNKDTQQWVEKEDTGVESATEKEKVLASVSFKRACTNWGIGRELYTAPEMFISKTNLATFTGENGKFKCYDTFKVASISYDQNRKIQNVVIDILNYGQRHHRLQFSSTDGDDNAIDTGNNDPGKKPTEAKASAPAPSPSTAEAKTPPVGKSWTLTDDEVLLFGNCRGKKYGDVKNTETFHKFLEWVRTANGGYENPKTQQQFLRIKSMVTTS